MHAQAQVPGRIVQTESPYWEPIVALLADELAAWFMWMFEVELADATRLHAYKHSASRRYLMIDLDGRAYADNGAGLYVRRDLPASIAHAFVGWTCAGACERDVAMLHAAVARARARAGRAA